LPKMIDRSHKGHINISSVLINYQVGVDNMFQFAGHDNQLV